MTDFSTPARLTRRSAITALSLTPLARAARAAAPQSASPADMLPALQRLAQDLLARTGIPGLSIAIVHQDKTIYLQGFGTCEAGTSAKVDADTIFQLASLSKPLAATTMAGLVSDGVVAWDDPIIRHDPGFALSEPWVTSQVTIRDMLCHRSGLPDHAGDALEDIGYNQAEILHRLRFQKPGSSFRSLYNYTNFGFTAACAAAARAAGKSWAELSSERLYAPLAMRRTSSRFIDYANARNRAHTHMRDGGTWRAESTRDADAQSPAGGASSSARDMANWMRLQLANGVFAGKRIIAPAPIMETHRPQMLRTPPKNPDIDRAGFYGLGWNVDYDDSGRVHLGHSGAFNLGAATAITLLPQEHLGIVVLTNAQPIGLPEAICRSFLDLVLTGRLERDWLALFQPLFASMMAPDYGTKVDYARPPLTATPPLEPAVYAGVYRNDLYGMIEVKSTGSGLQLTLGPKHTAYAIRHFDRDVFTFQPTGENAYGPSAVTFAIGADGKAASITLENLDILHQGQFARVTGTSG